MQVVVSPAMSRRRYAALSAHDQLYKPPRPLLRACISAGTHTASGGKPFRLKKDAGAGILDKQESPDL